MDERETAATSEQARAREAVLELLASTLDQALSFVTDAARDRRLAEIEAACDRIGFLGQAVRRLRE